MNFSERIDAVMRHYKLQSKEMADLCGVQRTAISHILSGRNRPSVGFLSQLSEAFPELNTRWLLHGKGSMFTSVTSQNETNQSEDSSSQKLSIDIGNQSVKVTSKAAADDQKGDTNVTSAQSSSLQELDLPSHQKEIIRVVLFYADGTFTTHIPRQE